MFSKVPHHNNQSHLLSVAPEMMNIIRKSQDVEELQYYWEQYLQVTGGAGRLFKEYIDLSSEAAHINGYR